MNDLDFGPGSPGCIDCVDGHCTMNCSPRGRGDLKAKREEARTVLHMPAPPDWPDRMKAIAQVLASSIEEIPVTIYTAGGDRPNPLFELTRDNAVIFEDSTGLGRIVPGARELTIDGKRANLDLLDQLDWIKPTKPVADEHVEREQLADLAGLKIFADPRVPSREIWMGIDMSSGPDMTGYFDADGNLHIIIPGETL